MHQKQDGPERDELRTRFAAWLNITLCRARLKYLQRKSPPSDAISIEEIPEDLLVAPDTEEFQERSKTSFNFEEERLEKAFYSLPMKRQKILTMLFVEEKKPEEIARHLNCSVQYVYDQKYKAIKRLRLALEKDGDEK